MSPPLRVALRGVGRSIITTTSTAAPTIATSPIAPPYSSTCVRFKSQESEARQPPESLHGLPLDAERANSKPPKRLWKDPDSEPEPYVTNKGGDEDPDPNKAKLGDSKHGLNVQSPAQHHG